MKGGRRQRFVASYLVERINNATGIEIFPTSRSKTKKQTVIGGSSFCSQTTIRIMMRFILSILLLCVIYGESFYPTFLVSYKQRTCCFASSKDEEARRLKQEAERIRAEVASFEQEKKNVEREEERKEREILSQKQKVRMRYSAEVPILKGDGSTVVERVDFAPRMKKGMTIHAQASMRFWTTSPRESNHTYRNSIRYYRFIKD